MYWTYSPYPYAYHSVPPLEPDQGTFFGREFPPVNPVVFMASLKSFQSLMKKGSIILDHLASSQALALQVMDAAQKSDFAKVDQLIRSTGVTGDVKTSFTPDGITFHLTSNVQGTDCCHLRMSLRW